MEIIYFKRAEEDLHYWIDTNNKKILQRIEILLNSTISTPFAGIGKPEPLKNQFKGLWSRRITDEHRMIYEVEKNNLYIYSLKGHYND